MTLNDSEDDPLSAAEADERNGGSRSGTDDADPLAVDTAASQPHEGGEPSQSLDAGEPSSTGEADGPSSPGGSDSPARSQTDGGRQTESRGQSRVQSQYESPEPNQDGGDQRSGRGQSRADHPGGRPPQGQGSGSGGISPLKRVGVVLISILLFFGIVATIGLFAVQGTVLDAQYVAGTMDSEGTYSELETTAEDAVIEETQGSLGGAGEILPDPQSSVERTVRDSITEAYVKQEVERNLVYFYAYLHGEHPVLNLTINTQPVLDNTAEAVEEDILEYPLAEILQHSGIEESFAGYPVDLARVGEAIDDEQTYYEVQSDLQRATQRSGLTTREIQEDLRGNIDPPAPLEDSVYEMQDVIVLAMTSDMPYEEFRNQLEQARAQFAADAGEYVENQLSQEVPATIDVDERLDQENRDQIDKAADNVQLLDTLKQIFPFLILLLIALVLLLTHSISTTARSVGIVLVVAGAIEALVGYLGSSIVLDRVLESMGSSEDFVISTVVALVEGLLGTITTYSLVVLVVGVVLIAISFAIRTYQPHQVPPAWR